MRAKCVIFAKASTEQHYYHGEDIIFKGRVWGVERMYHNRYLNSSKVYVSVTHSNRLKNNLVIYYICFVS